LTSAAVPPPAAADWAVDQLAVFDEDEDEDDVDELDDDELPHAATTSVAPTAPAASSTRLA
jgi:hypothetical protein